MYVRRVKRLPVVDAGYLLAGIISRADVLAFYDRPDVEIGEEIRNDIAVCESLADARRFNVTVTDGVVTLTGGPRTREQGHDVVRRARHIQGVVAVRDRLDYPPPGQGAFDVVASFPGRLMFGSDWPVCTLAGSYEQVLSALLENLEALDVSDAAREQIFGATAARFYRL